MQQSQYVQHIREILSKDTLNKVHQLLKVIPFSDGKLTATDAARAVKSNLQADANDTMIMPQLQQLIAMDLMKEPRFQTELYASKLYPFIFSKSETEMDYGWHVDSPLMGSPPIRTDLAMTIFLSDPSTYEGGELVIKTDNGEVSYKPAMGDAVVYPCQYVHCVKNITKGTRLAAVTWIQCSVRSMEQRHILSGLKRLHKQLAAKDMQSEETQAALQTWSNLLRMWAEL